MRKTSSTTIVDILKDKIVEEILKATKNRAMSKKIVKEAFSVCDEKAKILDAYLENCSPIQKEGYIKSFKSCLDIACNLIHTINFTDAEIVSYMFVKGYKLYKDYGGELQWMIYEKQPENIWND